MITEEHKETEYGKKEPMLIKNSIEGNKIAIKMVDEKFKHLEEKRDSTKTVCHIMSLLQQRLL